MAPKLGLGVTCIDYSDNSDSNNTNMIITDGKSMQIIPLILAEILLEAIS